MIFPNPVPSSDKEALLGKSRRGHIEFQALLKHCDETIAAAEQLLKEDGLPPQAAIHQTKTTTIRHAQPTAPL